MGAAMAAVTTCYRHHDRVTGASCTRCGKPICPDCMVQAPVGHHCPDCVREGNKGVRRPTWQVSASGGVVCKTLIALNVVACVLQQGDASFTSRYAMQPAAVAGGESYRLLTGAVLPPESQRAAGQVAAVVMVGAILAGLTIVRAGSLTV